MNKHEFADFIYDTRQDNQLTMKELAAEIGVSWTTVWRWENKRSCPRPDAIEFWVERILGAVEC